MPITLRKTIKIVIKNSIIRNGVKKDLQKAENKSKQAQNITIRTKTQTQKYLKG